MKYIFTLIIIFLTSCSGNQNDTTETYITTETNTTTELNITCEKIDFDENNLYFYKSIVKEVYDGDTITLDIDLGFNIWLRDEKIRLSGIDAPEIRTKDKEEKKRGFKSREYLKSLILNKEILIKTIKDKKGKFGRYIGEVFLNNENVNDKMVQQGHAIYKTY